MNIIAFTTKFQEVEEKFNLFKEVDGNGFEYWDIVRYDIFKAIYFGKSENKKKQNNLHKKNVKSKLKSVFQKAINIFSFYTHTYFKKYNYLCFVCSRYKNENGLNFDIASNDITKILKKNALIFESFPTQGKYLNDFIFNYGLTFFIRWNKTLNKYSKSKSQRKFEITSILKKEFDSDIDFDAIIINLIEKYKTEYTYYTKLFKRLKPKAIFLVQDGMQKGMFASANELNIPLIELQHGLIGYIHPAYSYPRSINVNQLKTLPACFFSFSPFWTNNLHFPVEKKVAIGNSFFAKKIIKDQPEYDILFIFTEIHTPDLIYLIDQLILKGFKNSICIKLHSNQYFQLAEIKNYFQAFEFITIVLDEKSIDSLLAISRSLLAIQSTCVYQALHNDVKVIIYKKNDYQTHIDIFDNPFVRLVDSADDIIDMADDTIHYNGNTTTYFNEFKYEIFKNFIKEII